MKRALVLVLVLTGCVSVKTEDREILRVAPLRGQALAAPSVDEAPPLIAAGADLLTDDELSSAQAALRRELVAQLEKTPPVGRALAGARLRIERCKLSGLAGRRATVHQARCRLSLRVGDAQLATHEASVVLEGPARAVTEAQAREIRKKTRNPLLTYERSEAVLSAAVLGAAEALLQPAPLPEDSAYPALRASALSRLSRAERSDQLASAAVDLAKYGQTEDALPLVVHLDHERALVRRAVATALAELLHRETWSAVNARLQNEEEDAVRVPLQQAIARMRALYPDLPAVSKSSTEGGRESGATP